MPETARRVRFRVRGIVRGVGFRPFAHAAATSRGLGGFVLNDPDGVLIEVEGEPGAIEDFATSLRADCGSTPNPSPAPPAAPGSTSSTPPARAKRVTRSPPRPSSAAAVPSSP